jgi:anti-anti-sigma factor
VNDPLARVEVTHPGPGQVALFVLGEVDLSNAVELGEIILAAIGDHSAAVVDLSAVQYLDSQGTRLLVDLALADHGAELIVVAPGDSVAGELLAISELHRLLDVRATSPW